MFGLPWKPGDDNEEPDDEESPDPYEWDDGDLSADVTLFYEQMLRRDAIDKMLSQLCGGDGRRYLTKWSYATRKRKRW
jgi:hypothetical protein